MTFEAGRRLSWGEEKKVSFEEEREQTSMSRGKGKTMQEHERVAFESERASARQGVRDRWSEGEKLQAEPTPTKRMREVSSRAIIIILIVALLVLLVVVLLLLLLLGAFAFVHVSSGTFPGPIPPP